MIIIRNIFVILLLSMGMAAQTKLIIFSEDNQTFVANLNNNNLGDRSKTLFEFNNINNEKVVLKVELNNNHKLKKTIKLKNNMQNIYTISNNDGYYEILYRGSYSQNEIDNEIVFNNKVVTAKKSVKVNTPKPKVILNQEEVEIDYAQNELININSIINELPNKVDDKAKTLFIVDELNKGKYNCRQLKFLFSKIGSDYSKLYTFKSTIHKCIDKENLTTLTQSFESEKYQDNFKDLISYL